MSGKLPLPRPGSARYARLEAFNSPVIARAKALAEKPPRVTKRRTSRPAEGFPQFFDKPENQAAAEWCAVQYTVDKLLGLEPDADRPHYAGMNREAVVSFFHRLDELTAGRSPAPAQSGA